MNPEFQRNLWLELTPRRMGLMVALLTLAFVAAGVSGGESYGLIGTAHWLFYAIVVVWGARNAALGVVGEIRDRTWDLQLLSSIGPGAMSWGKLFGSTIYNWFGGGLCLVVLLATESAHQGLAAALIDVVYFVVVGLIAQAAALLASLIAVRRKQPQSRLDVFIYQAVGIAAAVAVYILWSAADPAGVLVRQKAIGDVIVWWGTTVNTRGFLLLSLAVFAGWILTGCYREMRLELMMRNGTLVWLSFLLFIAVYVGGFDVWLSTSEMPTADASALRLGLVGTTLAVLTYLTVFLEPKDRVHYRWLGSQIAARKFTAAWNGLQAWMMTYLATVLCLIVLCVWLAHLPVPLGDPSLPTPLALAFQTAAALGFLTRDVAIFVLMQTVRRRGDLAALGTLLALYLLGPAILHGLGAKSALMLFYPQATVPAILGVIIAWAEGIAVAAFAIGRLALARTVETAAA